jgi:PAS domain S-box-containing protein
MPPLVGGVLVHLVPARSRCVISGLGVVRAIGALALVPLGLLFKPHYLLRHRDPRLLLETLTMAVTLALSWAAITWLPWPFTCVIVLLMWSAVRLPRMEAFLVFLVTVMVVSLMIAQIPGADNPARQRDAERALAAVPDAAPAGQRDDHGDVCLSRRTQTHHRKRRAFRNAMEYSAIGMALVSIEGQWLQANKALCNFLGYSQTELQSLTFQQLTWPEDLNTDLEQLEQLVNGDINTYSLEKRYYTRTGSGLGAACRLRRAPCRRLAALFYRPD